MPLPSQVKSSRMCSSRPPSTWGHFSLKSGHVSVPQRLPGLVRVKIKNRVKFWVRVRVGVRVRVSYIMTIWKWEEFSRCDKFPTTPVRSVIVQFFLLQCSYVVRDLLLAL